MRLGVGLWARARARARARVWVGLWVELAAVEGEGQWEGCLSPPDESLPSDQPVGRDRTPTVAE